MMALKKNILIIAGLSAFLYLAFFRTALAQPVFWVTWDADNYSPPWFEGKKIPTANTAVRMAFEAMENGKRLDLKNREISWSADDEVFRRGIGLQRISFPASRFSRNQTIKITVSQPDRAATHSFEWTVAKPEIAIDAPYPQKTVRFASSYQFKAWPFFFNVREAAQLTFEWKINGFNQSGRGNANILEARLPRLAGAQENSLIVEVRTNNPQNYLEFANSGATLKVKPL